MSLKISTLLLISACLIQTAFAQDVSVTPQLSKGYLLGPGDVITGKVLGEEEFNFVSTIDEDGKIQVPFFEQGITAKCRTEKELRAEVVQYLSKYLKNPQVSVQITERKSRPPVTVSGEFKSPAPIELRRTARLLEIVNISNGLTKDASGMIEVYHTQPPICMSEEEAKSWNSEIENRQDNPSKLYSYSSIKSGREESNPIIYPGDLIVARKAPPVYVIGEVMALREITIPESGLSLMEAIAQAGGFNREAKKKEITIQRLKPGVRDREQIVANYEMIKNNKEKDVMLEPSDIVIVNKTKKSIAETILEVVAGSARSFSQVLPQRVLY